VGFHNSYKQEHKIHLSNPTQGPHQKCPDQLHGVKMEGWVIQGGSDKSGIFFFLLSNDTAQLKIIRFD
jgi:hypothetical protein